MWRAASFAIALTFVSQSAFAQCTTDARRVVDELYRHILERGADAGSQQWQNQLSNGQLTVKELVRAIAKSQEHNQRFIRRENGEETPFIRSAGTLYRHILGRQPDPEGVRANALALERQGIGPVVDNLVDSAEYNQQNGNWGVPGSGGLSFCAPGNNQSNNQGNNQTGGAAAAPANEQGPLAAARFRGMDSNNDGSITQAEWQGNRQSFRMHDWNNDGVIAGEEVQTGRFRQGRTAEDEDFDRGERFEFLDENNNNRIELREWHASDTAFHQLDRNGDNYLTRAEMAGQNAGAVATTGANNNLVYVDANQRWTDTGINLTAGQTVVVDAQGTITLSAAANDTATPAGSRSGRRAPNSPVTQGPGGGLVARVGNGPATFLGQRGSMRAATSGRLYLGINDDYLDDNSGEYRVNVTVRGR